MTSLDFPAVARFVSDDASLDDLAAIFDALADRSKAIDIARMDSIAQGQTVRLDRLSPADFNGLTGTVAAVTRVNTLKPTADVVLDAQSTETLRKLQPAKIPFGAERHTVTVPLACVFPHHPEAK